ncbi:RNA-directed DNA polymerase, eukaryota, reverse transcriptase zinc-binding domain protein [Tanacetum coccineum]
MLEIKWSPELDMEKIEPKCLPVWVKIVTVPLEAWSVEGISAIASSLGKPMMMDANTAAMCHKGIGNFDFAKVLVEIDARKELKKEIVIQYRDKNNNVKGSKTIKVKISRQIRSSSHLLLMDPMLLKLKAIEMDSLPNGSIMEMTIAELMMVKGKKLGKDRWMQIIKKKEINGNKVQQKKWNVKEKHVEETRKNANKFSILNSLPEDNIQGSRTLKERLIEENIRKEGNESIKEVDVEDVFNSPSGTGNFMESNEVCAILETRLKSKKLQKACNKVFHDWEWVSNMEFKCYYSFVYAVNTGVERRDPWRTLCNDYRYVNGKPWCIFGDMNVILHPSQHSCGSSNISTDMMEFHDCLNTIEVEDLCCSGLHFTWTKNLHKARMGIMTGVLKKLDIILSNEGFIKDFPQAHAKFLPYLISDHTPAILCIPSNDIQTSIDVDPYNHSLRIEEANLVKELCEAESYAYPVQVLDSCDTLFKEKLSSADASKMITNVTDFEIK